MKKKEHLREGYTTGSTVTGACVAGLRALLQLPQSDTARIVLPPCSEESNYAELPIAECRVHKGIATATLIKDAGDDPDVTHKTPLCAKLSFESSIPQNTIVITGGIGIGKVTRNGLPVPVGEYAINPVPQEQIRYTLQKICTQYTCNEGIHIEVFAPEGERLAKKTLNPRLGIIGGISILGTHGIVRPYSASAWKDTIEQALSVAHSAGRDTIYFTTGRRSEVALMKKYSKEPDFSFIQIADYASFALERASEMGFRKVIWGCFIGKLVKLAQGFSYTHAHVSELSCIELASWCALAGARPSLVHKVQSCILANEALSYILQEENYALIIGIILEKGKHAMEQWLNNSNISCGISLFSLETGVEIGSI